MAKSCVVTTRSERDRLLIVINGPRRVVSRPEPLAKSGLAVQIRLWATDKKMGKPNNWFAHFNLRVAGWMKEERDGSYILWIIR